VNLRQINRWRNETARDSAGAARSPKLLERRENPAAAQTTARPPAATAGHRPPGGGLGPNQTAAGGNGGDS